MTVIYHVESLSELTLGISFFITTGSRKCVLFFAGGEMAEWRGVMTCLRFLQCDTFLCPYWKSSISKFKPQGWDRHSVCIKKK